MLMWPVMNQWLSLLRPGLQRSDLQYPAWQGWAFTAFYLFNREDCFRRCLNESGLLTFRVDGKSPYTSDMSAQEYLSFLSVLKSKWDELSQTHIPHSCIHSLTLKRWFIFYSLEIKLSMWFHIVKWLPTRPLESLLFLWDEDHVRTNYSSPSPAPRQALSSS